MTYDPMRYASARAGVIGQTVTGVGMSIAGVVEKIPELIKRKNIDTELKQAYLETLETFADKATEASPEMPREEAMLMGMRFYQKRVAETPAAEYIKTLASGDVPAEKYLEDLKVKKFRSQSGQPVTTEGPAGPDYQPPGTPQVNIAGSRDLSTIQRDVHSQMLREPRTTVPQTPDDMYQRGADLGITETPAFESDFQQQQNVEAGLLHQPGQTKGDYSSDAATMGIDPSTGAAKEIGTTKMSEQQIAADERARLAAEQRGKYQDERNRIAEQRNRAYALRVASQNRALTKDETKDILRNQAQNTATKIRLESQINMMKRELTQKSRQVDPKTYRPLFTAEELDELQNDLVETTNSLYELNEIDESYKKLLVKKGFAEEAPIPKQNRKPLSDRWTQP